MTNKKEKQEKEKPVRFNVPLDATDEDLQAVIDALKHYCDEINAKKINQTPESKQE